MSAYLRCRAPQSLSAGESIRTVSVRTGASKTCSPIAPRRRDGANSISSPCEPAHDLRPIHFQRMKNPDPDTIRPKPAMRMILDVGKSDGSGYGDTGSTGGPNGDAFVTGTTCKPVRSASCE